MRAFYNNNGTWERIGHNIGGETAQATWHQASADHIAVNDAGDIIAMANPQNDGAWGKHWHGVSCPSSLLLYGTAHRTRASTRIHASGGRLHRTHMQSSGRGGALIFTIVTMQRP